MASPFSIFRKHQKVFMAVAAVIAIFVFVVADSLTSMMSSDQGGSEKTVVTSWSGGEMTVREIRNLQQRRYFISEVLRNIHALGRSRVEAEGGTALDLTVTPFYVNPDASPESVAQQVVYDRVLADLARKSGMVVSMEVINHYLDEIGLGRVLGSETQQILSQIRRYKSTAVSEQVLIDGLRELLLGNNYMQSLSTSLDGADPSLVWNEWMTLNDRIKLQVAVLPAKDFLSQVEEPSDVQLVDFYEKHKDQVAGGFVRRGGKEFPAPSPGFRQPRKVKLKFLLGDVSAWTEKMLEEVTDEEIADYYERNKRTQFMKFDPIFEGEDSEMLDEIFETDSDGDESGDDTTGEDETDEEAETDAEESPADDEEPAAEDSGQISSKSPFRLTAFQDDLEDDAGEEDEVTNEDSEADAEETDDADASAETEASDEEEEDESRYEPLEKVSDQIRRLIATDKAVEAMSKVMDGAYSELTSVYNRYGVEVVAAEADKTDPPEVPARLADLSTMAEEKELFLEETIPLNASELSKTAVGKAIDSQTASMPVVQMAFQTLKLYQPALAVDIDGYRYLVLKVEDIDPVTPSLEDAREEVVEAWKMAEAKRLALEKGQEIAKQAEEEGSSLIAAVDEEKFEIVVTDFFSRFSFGSTRAEMQRGPRLSDVPPLEHIGAEFLQSVFALEDDGVLALPNFDSSSVYVVRIDQKERTEDELHQAFLEEVNTSQALRILQAYRTQRMQQAMANQVIFQSGGLDGRRLQQFLQGPAE